MRIGGDTYKVVLYSYWRSSCSWRVRIALEHYGIDYEYRPVHLVKDGGQQFKSEYVDSVNLMSQVPVLELEKFDDPAAPVIRLTQSVAILEFLEDVMADSTAAAAAAVSTDNRRQSTAKYSLIPDRCDPVLRAKIRQVVEIINSGIQPLQNLSTIKAISDDPNVRSEWSKRHIENGLKSIEHLVSSGGGDTKAFCFTNTPTIAECCLVPQVYNAKRFNVDMDQFPRIVAVCERLDDVSAFQRAHPDRQPDCPQ